MALWGQFTYGRGAPRGLPGASGGGGCPIGRVPHQGATHAASIAAHLPPGGVVVELGCGDSSKTAILLEVAMRGRRGAGQLRFCGVDCSAEALRQTQRNLRRLLPQLPEEQVELYTAEYLAGVAAVRRRHPDALLTCLWLGSSVGNFSGGEAASFLTELRRVAGERCQLLLCTDLWKDEGVLRRAYDDSQGVSEAFILNGMHHALGTVGHPDAYCQGLWQYGVVVNRELKQVEMYVRAQRRVADVLPGVHVEEGERVLVEISRKFTPDAVAGMAFEAGWCPGAAWGNCAYRMQLLLTPELALQRCWRDTDSLFSGIRDWQAQPIGLRHPFCFYFGHVAAFSRLKMLPQDAASELDSMLSRGIDPPVLDPAQCHSHPPVPPSWPSRQQLLGYVAAVRQQLLAAARQGVHASATGNSSGSAGVDMRCLCMALEHERMHQETLCYMLAQQRKADAAATTSGQPDALPASTPAGHGGVGVSLPAADSSGDGLLHEAPSAADVPPFYLEQCSYLSAAVPPVASPSSHPAPLVCSKNGAADTQPLVPTTPAKASEVVTKQLAAMRVGGQLAQSPAPRTAAPSSSTPSSTPEGFVLVMGEEVQLGVDPAGDHGFLWDCELGRLAPPPVGSLLVAEAAVTVAQFRSFVFEERGYERPELWDAGAYRHLQASRRSLPATWSLLGSAPTAAGDPATASGAALHLWVHLPEGSYCWEEVACCPVYVSQAEAQAYCRLHGGRLMTEAEWELAVGSDAVASGALRQLEAGGWEWTSSVLEPLPGFQADPLYPEYSVDFFDGQHYVLRGASPYTHPSMVRRSFRNWYQTLYPHAFAKFRLVRDAT